MIKLALLKIFHFPPFEIGPYIISFLFFKLNIHTIAVRINEEVNIKCGKKILVKTVGCDLHVPVY